MKVFIIINEDVFFLSHRLPIAVAALKEGYEVTLVAKDTGLKNRCLEECSKYGRFNFIDSPINPTGMNPVQELKTLVWLYRLFRKNKPDIVHAVGLKCILWGGLAAKLARIHVVINAVSGLGIMFSSDKLSLAAKMMLGIQRFSNNRENVFVIFQNNDDKSLYIGNKVIKEDQVCFIKGSGVDLDEFPYTPDPDGDKINVIFTARMVKEKGVCDLIEAAEILRPEYENRVEFWLCGGLSSNPKALTEAELTSMCDGRYIKWLGFRKDVKELLQKSNIVAFPSYYREGVPKSLIDASAIGRPIVTCDSVGCRDVVVEDENGFLIKPHDVKSLANRIQLLIDNKDLRVRMGRVSRDFAEKDFSIKTVVDKHLYLYEFGNK